MEDRHLQKAMLQDPFIKAGGVFPVTAFYALVVREDFIF